MNTQIQNSKLLLAAFVWFMITAKQAQAINISAAECGYPPGQPHCTEFICPTLCPNLHTDDPAALQTCLFDCHHPTCQTSCWDEVKKVQIFQCNNLGSRCFGRWISCPSQCPYIYPDEHGHDSERACFIDCDSPLCQATCRYRRPSCYSLGAACYDPRFVGGDGVVFYFHGRSNETFNLVSDTDLQINGRFIGHRPAGRPRDFTWIQALGIIFNSHVFTLEATKTPTWDQKVDHLRFTYNGQDIVKPERNHAKWYSPDATIKVERISSRNNAIVTLVDKAEIMVNVVPITKKDNLVHNYQIPENDSFAHLEVQFRFSHLSPKVDGVLGRTYKPNFENNAKFGTEMPTLGDHDKYKTPSLTSSDCKSCVFSGEAAGSNGKGIHQKGDYPALNCSGGASPGYGIICKK